MAAGSGTTLWLGRLEGGVPAVGHHQPQHWPGQLCPAQASRAAFDSKLPFGLPARKAADSSMWAKFKATLWDIKSVVTVPTFAIIIVQVRASLRASAVTQCELANTLSCYYVHLHIVSVKACCRQLRAARDCI